LPTAIRCRMSPLCASMTTMADPVSSETYTREAEDAPVAGVAARCSVGDDRSQAAAISAAPRRHDTETERRRCDTPTTIPVWGGCRQSGASGRNAGRPPGAGRGECRMARKPPGSLCMPLRLGDPCDFAEGTACQRE
jgi:hypothetical protein